MPPEKSVHASLSSQNSNPLVDKDPSPASGLNSALTLEDFELVKVIGKGGFSKVF